MLFVFTVGNQTLQIFAANAAEALRRAQIVFPGQNISGLREGGQAGDANFRLISPTSFDAQGNPIYTAESATGDPTGAVTGTQGTADGSQVVTAQPQPTGELPPLPPVTTPGLETQSQRGAFQDFLGQLGAGGVGLAGDFAQGQFNPAASAFAAQQQAGLTPGVPEESQFSDFLTRAGGFGSQQLANRAIGDIGNQVRSRQGGGGIDPGSRLGLLLNPETERQANELFGLSRIANPISPLVRDLRDTLQRNQLDAVFGEFARSRAGGAAGNFAQFLGGRGFGGLDFGSRLGF